MAAEQDREGPWVQAQCSGDWSLCPSTGAPGSALPKHPASPRPRGPGASSGLDRFRMEAAGERGPGLSRRRRCQEETRGPGSSLCPSQLLRSTTHSAQPTQEGSGKGDRGSDAGLLLRGPHPKPRWGHSPQGSRVAPRVP